MQVKLRALLALAAAMCVLSPGLAAAQDPGRSAAVEIVPQIAGEVYGLAYSPDGKWIVTASGDTAKLWEAASGRLVRSFEGHAGEVWSVAFSPDGRQIVTGSNDDTAKVWDVASGKVAYTIRGPDSHVYAVAFSPDGNSILLGLYKAAMLWDVASARFVRTFEGHSERTVAVAFSPDGTRVLTGNWDRTARLWDTATGRLLRKFTHSDCVEAAAFSPDGARVVTGSRDETAKVWDVESGALLHTLAGHGTYAYSVAVSPDGGIATGTFLDGTIRLWDADGKLRTSFKAHDDSVHALAFSSDGRQLATGGEDSKAKIWDVASRGLVQTFAAHSDPATAMALAPDGNWLVTAAGNNANVWDVGTGRLLRILKGHILPVRAVAIAQAGDRIATAGWDNTAKVWAAGSGALDRTFDAGPLFTGNEINNIEAVAFSGDAAVMVTGHGNNTARIWQVESGKLVRTLKTQAAFGVDSVAVSPDGSRIATGHERVAKLWDAKSGKLVRTIKEPEPVKAVVFSPDGKWLATAVSNDFFSVGYGRLWDVKSGRVVRTFAGQPGGVESIAFSPDGTLFATGSGDNTAMVWDVASGGLVQTIKGHVGTVESVAFTPDGRRLVTTSADSTTRIWDIGTGAQQVQLVVFDSDDWVAITPEGFFDASAKGAEQLNVARGMSVYSIEQVYQALYRPDLVAAKLAGDPEGKVREAAARLDLDKVLESGGAPKVAIVSPAEGASLDADTVAVEADVTDQGGGVGKIEWRVNGVTLGIDARGFDRLAAEAAGAGSTPSAGATAAPAATMGKTIRVTQKLSLDPGENRIEVVAYNAKGLIASDPVAVTVKWEGASAATAPKLYVLAVGVNDYWDSRLKLTYAVPDARAIGEAFRKGGGKLYESVEVTTVLDAEVTAGNLDKVFADLGTKVRPLDVFVFFLAGHGKTEDGRYYFLPQDFRYEDASSVAKGGIDQDRFQAWFAQIAARKSVLLYDTCDSGSLTGGLASRGLEEVAALARMTRAMGRTVLSASTDDAPALEGYRNHGVFTYALLDALGSGDANRDGTIEVTELAGAIDKSVPEISYAAFKLRQVPQMSIVGSDFPLATQTAVLEAAAGVADAIPATPTHVVIVTASVREAADESATAVVELTPGGQVRLVETANGWSLIARDGKRLGYVRETVLAAMH